MPTPGLDNYVNVFDTVLGALGPIVQNIDSFARTIDPTGFDSNVQVYETSDVNWIYWNANFDGGFEEEGSTAIECLPDKKVEIAYIAQSFEAIGTGMPSLFVTWTSDIVRVEWWAGQLQDVLIAACSAWGPPDCLVEIVSTSIEAFLGGCLTVWNARFKITSGEDVSIANRRGCVLTPASGTTDPHAFLRNVYQATNNKPKPGQVGVGSYVGNSAIVEALQDISQMRTELSINNGAAMYSVSGGTRAEEV